MMKLLKIEGIVINEQAYGESSKILKIFTRDLGVISVMSRGCKKVKSPFRVASSKLIHANFDISYKENGISTLVGVDIINYFKNIVMDYHDLERKIYAFSLIDLTNQMINHKEVDDDEKKEIYDLFISTLNKMDSLLNARILLDIIMLKYLKFLGVNPSLDCCSNCGKKSNIVTMTSETFGFICDECYTNQKIVDKKALKLTKMLYMVDIDRITNLDVDESIHDVEKFISDYYNDHTGLYFNIDKKLKIVSKIEEI